MRVLHPYLPFPAPLMRFASFLACVSVREEPPYDQLRALGFGDSSHLKSMSYFALPENLYFVLSKTMPRSKSYTFFAYFASGLTSYLVRHVVLLLWVQD